MKALCSCATLWVGAPYLKIKNDLEQITAQFRFNEIFYLKIKIILVDNLKIVLFFIKSIKQPDDSK